MSKKSEETASLLRKFQPGDIVRLGPKLRAAHNALHLDISDRSFEEIRCEDGTIVAVRYATYTGTGDSSIMSAYTQFKPSGRHWWFPLSDLELVCAAEDA